MDGWIKGEIMNEPDEIYIKADPKIIHEVLESIRDRIGDGVHIVDLKPQLKEDDFYTLPDDEKEVLLDQKPGSDDDENN
jgi:hypothetical protein